MEKTYELTTTSFIGVKNVILSVLKFYEKVFNKAFEALEFLFQKTYKALIILTWLAVGVVIYWSFFDTTSPIIYMHYSNAVFYTPNDSKVENGIQYTKSYCFTRDTDVTIYPTLTNDIIYNVPNRGKLHYAKGCSSEHIFLEVPTEFPNGTYEYRANYDILQNPVRDIHKSFNVFTLTILDAQHCKYKVDFEN